MLPPEKLPLQKYEERYCAFVDILGFSDLINRLKKGETDFTAVRGLLRVIHDPPFMVFSEVAEKSDFRAQQISDAVCISTICNAAGLNHLFAALTEMSMRLLHAGYFVRGALVKGIVAYPPWSGDWTGAHF